MTSIKLTDSEVIKEHRCSNNAQLQRAIKEISFMSSLSHSNICKITDWSYRCENGEVVIQMTLPRGLSLSDKPLGGESLDSSFLSNKTLRETHLERKKEGLGIMEIARDLLVAVAVLHESGIAHHDIKPTNLIVMDGKVQLIDFDIAEQCNFYSFDRPDYGFKEAEGTEGYFDPEYLSDEWNPITVELYAVAVTLYYIAKGEYPSTLYGFCTDNEELDNLIKELTAPLSERESAYTIAASRGWISESDLDCRSMPMLNSKIDITSKTDLTSLYSQFPDSCSAEIAFLALYLAKCVPFSTESTALLFLASAMRTELNGDIDMKTAKAALDLLKELKGLTWSTTPWNYCHSEIELPALLSDLLSPNFDMSKIGCIKDVILSSKEIDLKRLRSLKYVPLDSINYNENLLPISIDTHLDISSYITEGYLRPILAVALRTHDSSLVPVWYKESVAAFFDCNCG